MGTFIYKDLLVFWRDRKEILLALLLPILIIVVLNFAFSGLFNEDEEAVHIEIAVVQEDDVDKGKEQFENAVEKKALSSEEKNTVLAEAAKLDPVRLVADFLNSPDMQDWVTVKDLSEQEAEEQVKNGQLDAVVKIPEGFTNNVLSSVLLGEPSQGFVSILAAKQSTEVSTLQEIVHNYLNTLNMHFALGRKAMLASAEPVLPQGGKEVVEGDNGVDTYTMSQYFTIAIGTLFALFMSQTVALKTSTEKREQVFNRILLTNRHPLVFLLGKTVSAFILACMQFAITLTVVQLLLNVFPDKSFTFWAGLGAVLIAFALTVGGLSALFTAITLHLSDSNAASGISTLIIMGFGVLGGSFFPLEGLPEPIQKIGEWTPNGLTQIALIEWVQYSHFNDLLFPILFLMGVCIICFAISVSIFPKRGRS
ncbi:ABC-2 type transport system permease protein [Cytobacillus oceanisediminis]|uniref:ABC-2 type transport system permease protein n=1 Tax=Cytobacillus oceanisediminis TaxID=665099 RepID=A0A2V3A7Y7_9BACI|nr:ABC transporter permease [Cytobacillus oceanisediminis]PWW32291.1 ABC-2 type transport system permease protein [Cytobacillus oceanisediminis]